MLAVLIATTVPHSTQAVGSGAYNIAYIILAVLTMVGMGVAVTKWLRKQGATEAAVKKLLELQTALQQIVDANVLQRLSNQDEALADIKRSMRPNGLKDDALGNVVKRTEIVVSRLEGKVDLQAEKLSEHVGAAQVEEREIWRAIKELGDGKGERK